MDIMIDCETLSTSPNCVILSIGAVLFDIKGQGVLDKLQLKPTIEEQSDIFNREICDGTVEWWSKQSPEAIEEAMGDDGRISFKDAMEKLYKFCWNRRAIWSNGAGFDVVVCESAYRQLGMQIPWSYYSVRDTRTLFEVAGVNLRDPKYKTKINHKAVDDAEHQAIVVQDAYKKLIKAGLVT